ncbi:dTDP-4-dehydrorhamnose 3,5-epimerase [Cytobacillus firmus]|jgi:dTDP-4-dehydrorhamnose 3,5-epimerase|nr:dTDP-4-dehydrorhamnose 3,5-epimerase [Cytobacillus firmus]
MVKYLKFNLINSSLPGCYEIVPEKFVDERGSLIKLFHDESFHEKGLQTNFAEEYFSVSNKNVLRGLHFQVPPKDHIKLVSSISGEIFDVVVDLRIGSPSYGEYEIFTLSGEKGNMVYIPQGLAHGFYVKKYPAIINCKTTTIFSPKYDRGIHWSSLNIPWPNKTPIVSKKDNNLPDFKQFESPFYY